MKIIRKIAAASAILALTAGAALAAEPATLKLSTAAPENTVWGMQVNRLAEAIAEESEGRLKVEPFFNSQLGNENDTLAQLARGRIDMGVFTVNAAALQAPGVGLFQLFSYYDSNAQRACVQQEHLSDEMRAQLADKGVYFGGWAEVGNVYIMSNREIHGIEDLQGLKAGISVNKYTTEFWKALGANPVPVNPAEVASGLSTGLIDLYATVYSFYIPTGMNKIAPVVSEFNIASQPGMFAVSQRVMDRLAPEDQAAIKRAFARFPADMIMNEILAFEDQIRKLHKNMGGAIYQPSDEAIAAFRDRLPAYWDAMFGDFGEEGLRIKQMIDDGKAACGS